jgi:hypothetical protein
MYGYQCLVLLAYVKCPARFVRLDVALVIIIIIIIIRISQ